MIGLHTIPRGTNPTLEGSISMGFVHLPSQTLDMDMEPIPKTKFDEREDAIWDSYSSWIMEHPSALDEFEQMMSAIQNKKIVVFLDYDGTLSDIVEDPDKAFMTETMRSAVREVAECYPTAIISGRRREKVQDFVKLDDIYYAGSHGMDIISPVCSNRFGGQEHHRRVVDEKGNEIVLFQPAADFLPKVEGIFRLLTTRTKNIKGSRVEDNKFCVSVHFRCVHQKVIRPDTNALKEVVESVLEDYPDFRVTRGKKVLEVRPLIEWDKGHALEYLLDTLGFDSSDVVPIYLGDDRTDEDAFKMITTRGEGYPIIVSSVPKETKASHSLRDTKEVMQFLQNLARWSTNSSLGNS
ncbi:probable trehalose-phosphate phosphatase D isoform X1 [Vitis riparia]|uniref:probable trehalose-phosphate phosphatase D isoform X1 n=2 Tax=Vitis riparia TaxID=96939 RepID=UPI00155B18C2|nr:probable trehalose-phosphate phosphatase D isoform X1 [Vitis riparia]